MRSGKKVRLRYGYKTCLLIKMEVLLCLKVSNMAPDKKQSLFPDRTVQQGKSGFIPKLWILADLTFSYLYSICYTYFVGSSLNPGCPQRFFWPSSGPCKNSACLPINTFDRVCPKVFSDSACNFVNKFPITMLIHRYELLNFPYKYDLFHRSP